METLTSSAAPGPSTDASTFSGRPKVEQVVFDLFDEYVHGLIDRRGFLERASKLAATGATAGMTATALLDALNPRFAEAQQVPKNDKRVKVTLACEDCKRRNYITVKSRVNDRERIEMKKYCRWDKRHTVHKETR